MKIFDFDEKSSIILMIDQKCCFGVCWLEASPPSKIARLLGGVGRRQITLHACILFSSHASLHDATCTLRKLEVQTPPQVQGGNGRASHRGSFLSQKACAWREGA
jgi:hypothetical protein